MKKSLPKLKIQQLWKHLGNSGYNKERSQTRQHFLLNCSHQFWRTFWGIWNGNILNGAVKLCIPVCKRRPCKNKNINKPKWWNSQIETGLLLKKHAHDKYLLSQNENDKIKYERLRCKTKKMIRQSKKDLEIYIANKTKTNLKEFYTYVRNKKSYHN